MIGSQAVIEEDGVHEQSYLTSWQLQDGGNLDMFQVGDKKLVGIAIRRLGQETVSCLLDHEYLLEQTADHLDGLHAILFGGEPKDTTIARLIEEREEAMSKSDRLHTAIIACLSYFGGRQSEMGERAQDALAILEAALQEERDRREEAAAPPRPEIDAVAKKINATIEDYKNAMRASNDDETDASIHGASCVLAELKAFIEGAEKA